MADADQLRSLIISGMRGVRLVTGFDVAACTIFIWDYTITFGMEVDFVWKSRWNFMKGLYLFQRYFPFIDTVGLVLYYQTTVGLTKTSCQNIYYGNAVMTVIGFGASDMVLTLRTWAVWNQNRRLTIILPILYLLVWGGVFVILTLFIESVKFGDPPFKGFAGCFVTQANQDLIFVWALLMVWDTLLLVLMLVPGFHAYRSGGHSVLMKVVYRDGIVYYLCLFTLSVVNILVLKFLPPRYQPQLLTSVERVLRSMLTSRVIFDIRAQAGVNPVQSDAPTELNTKRFRGGDA